jgi:hypothetical protein
MLAILLVALGLIVVHEVGHIVATVRSGGRFLGLVVRGFAVGVKLEVSPLSTRQRLWSQAAGPLAEVAAAFALTGAAVLALVPPHLVSWTWGVVLLDALLNLTPWWGQNDGARIRAHWQALALERIS